MPNIPIFAWSRKGGWVETASANDGSYTLNVSKGNWEVVAEPNHSSSYAPPTSQRVKLRDREIATVNFTMSSAGHTISGSVRDSDMSLITSLQAWAYARSYDSSAPNDFEVVTDVPVVNGKFTLKLPPGEFRIGLWIGPESDYSMSTDASTGEAEVALLLSGAESITEIDIIAERNNSVISGTFLDANGDAITNLDGEVFAVMGSNWKSAVIDPNDGTYSLLLPPGSWRISYYIDADSSFSYLPRPSADIQVTTVSGSTVTQNITLLTVDGSIIGTVLDPAGSALTETVYAWVYRDVSQPGTPRYFDEVDAVDGQFVFNLPSGYKYKVGLFLPDGIEYFEPKSVPVDLRSTTNESVTLTLLSSDAIISGNATYIGTGELIEEAYVYAWSDDGQTAETQTDSSGAYSLSLSSGSVWNVGADFETENGEAYKTVKTVTIDMSTVSSVTQDLILVAQSYTLPNSVADTFTASVGYSKVLSDGTEINIPANAIPVSDSSETITINIRPVVSGLSSSSTTQPISYGFEFDLFDSKGKAITQNFTQDVVITINYTDQQLADLGITEDEISISFFSSTKKTWERASKVTVDAENNKIFASTDHFTPYAVTGNQSGGFGLNSDPAITGSTFFIPESATNGTVVGAATGLDDDGDTLTYSFSAGNDAGLFAINSSSGSITVVGTLDYESTQSHTLTVTVTDTGSATASADFTVTVTDVNDNSPVFAQTSYSTTVNDTDSAGTTLVKADATDVDAGTTLIYSITAGNDGGLFSINSSSGTVITAGSLLNDAGSHSVTLSASDGTNSGTATLTVTINDTTAPSAPTLTGSSLTNDSTPTWTGVAEASATVTVLNGGVPLGQVETTPKYYPYC